MATVARRELEKSSDGNDLDFRLINAERLAAETIEEFGICTPEHIRFRDIAFAKDAVVVGACGDDDAGLSSGSSYVYILDTDGDEVPADDTCPNSDLNPNVVIDGCDSGVDNYLLNDGCTILDRIYSYPIQEGR